MASEIATTLSSSRFQGVVEQARELNESKREDVANQIAAKFEEMETKQKTSYFENQATQFAEFKSILEVKDKQIERLQKTLKYVKRQKRRGK